MRFLQGNQFLSRVFRVLANGKEYIEVDDIFQALAAFTSCKSGNGEALSQEKLMEMAKQIVNDIIAARDTSLTSMFHGEKRARYGISRHEFMRMPRLRVGDAPALLSQAVNNIRTGNVAAEVMRSARLDLYWQQLSEKACAASLTLSSAPIR